MTQRVSLLEESNSKSEYQLPSGQQWWLCRYTDGDKVSEILFTDEKVMTWFQANQFISIQIGYQTPHVVTLYEPPHH